MAQHFSQLLAGLAADPQERLSHVPLMSAEERQLTIETFNATNAPVRQATVHGVFEASAAAQPSACCLLGDGVRLSYSQVYCTELRALPTDVATSWWVVSYVLG
jgi:non-ribosomal peptide synthetase component F